MSFSPKTPKPYDEGLNSSLSLGCPTHKFGEVFNSPTPSGVLGEVATSGERTLSIEEKLALVTQIKTMTDQVEAESNAVDRQLLQDYPFFQSHFRGTVSADQLLAVNLELEEAKLHANPKVWTPYRQLSLRSLLESELDAQISSHLAHLESPATLHQKFSLHQILHPTLEGSQSPSASHRSFAPTPQQYDYGTRSKAEGLKVSGGSLSQQHQYNTRSKGETSQYSSNSNLLNRPTTAWPQRSRPTLKAIHPTHLWDGLASTLTDFLDHVKDCVTRGYDLPSNYRIEEMPAEVIEDMFRSAFRGGANSSVNGKIKVIHDSIKESFGIDSVLAWEEFSAALSCSNAFSQADRRETESKLRKLKQTGKFVDHVRDYTAICNTFPTKYWNSERWEEALLGFLPGMHNQFVAMSYYSRIKTGEFRSMTLLGAAILREYSPDVLNTAAVKASVYSAEVYHPPSDEQILELYYEIRVQSSINKRLCFKCASPDHMASKCDQQAPPKCSKCQAVSHCTKAHDTFERIVLASRGRLPVQRNILPPQRATQILQVSEDQLSLDYRDSESD